MCTCVSELPVNFQCSRRWLGSSHIAGGNGFGAVMQNCAVMFCKTHQAKSIAREKIQRCAPPWVHKVAVASAALARCCVAPSPFSFAVADAHQLLYPTYYVIPICVARGRLSQSAGNVRCRRTVERTTGLIYKQTTMHSHPYDSIDNR